MARRSARADFRQRGVPEETPLHIVHHIERGADHRGVLAQGVRPGPRAPRVCCERRDHAILAIDGMGRRQQLARRLAPEHVAMRRPIAPETWDWTDRPRTDCTSMGPEKPSTCARIQRGERAVSKACCAGGDRSPAAGLFMRSRRRRPRRCIVRSRGGRHPRPDKPRRPSGRYRRRDVPAEFAAITAASIFSSTPLDIFDGKNPGQIALTRMP